VGHDDWKHEALQSQLNDFVDECLDGESRREVAEHLRDCAVCRREVADLRELLAAGAVLPTDREPQRDLWPGIASQIGAAAVSSDAAAAAEAAQPPRNAEPTRAAPARLLAAIFSPVNFSRASLSPANLAAAAVLALVLIGATAIWRSGQPVNGGAGGAGGAGDLASVDRRPMTGVMTSDAAAARTLLALEAETRSVPQETVAIGPTIGPTSAPGDRGLGEGALTALGQTLNVVDAAIMELQAAWLANPNNGDLGRRLAVTYTTRARLQSRANRLHATL